MDTIAGKIGDYLVTQGLSGIVILASWFVIWKLWSVIQDVQEKRIAEATKNVETANNTSNALNRLSDLLRDRKG